MNEKLVRRALEFYGGRVEKVFAEQKGYRNRSFRVRTEVGEDLNLIFYKSEAGILERIRRADELSEAAFDAGLSVRHLYDKRILVLEGAERKIYARLYHYLPGRTVAWEMFSMNHIKLLGWAMSDLHFVLSSVEVDLPLAVDEMLSLNGRMGRYFGGGDVRRAMRDKLGLEVLAEDFKEILGRAGKLKTQPLHLDLVRGNLLFERNEKENGVWRIGRTSLSGVIDFEKAAAGHVVLDMARSYAFLLVDVAGKTPEKIFKYLVESGYQKRGKQKIELDPRLFEGLVKFFLTYDFYKFLRHNPYEALSKNHHFLRTRDILLEKKVIKLV